MRKFSATETITIYVGDQDYDVNVDFTYYPSVSATLEQPDEESGYEINKIEGSVPGWDSFLEEYCLNWLQENGGTYQDYFGE
jgi:hypothetical protein